MCYNYSSFKTTITPNRNSTHKQSPLIYTSQIYISSLYLSLLGYLIGKNKSACLENEPLNFPYKIYFSKNIHLSNWNFIHLVAQTKNLRISPFFFLTCSTFNQSSWPNLQNISKIQPLFITSFTTTLLLPLSFSYFCSYYLQTILNPTATEILPETSHIMSFLYFKCWLPTSFRLKAKVLPMSQKALCNVAHFCVISSQLLSCSAYSSHMCLLAASLNIPGILLSLHWLFPLSGMFFPYNHTIQSSPHSDFSLNITLFKFTCHIHPMHILSLLPVLFISKALNSI